MEYRFVIGTQASHKCAFCKNWYDPTNSAIKPVAPQINMWAIVEGYQKAKCLHFGTDKVALLTCQYFESKV